MKKQVLVSVDRGETRVALLEKIITAYKARMQDIAVAISDEMGAPMKLPDFRQIEAGGPDDRATRRTRRMRKWIRRYMLSPRIK